MSAIDQASAQNASPGGYAQHPGAYYGPAPNGPHPGQHMKRKGATDGTVYGTARTSTRSFFVHYLSAVAAGVMHADALSR